MKPTCIAHPAYTLVVTFLFFSVALGGRIMMVSVLGSKSTAHNFQFIGEELAARGHKIILVFQKGVKPSSSPNISYAYQDVPNEEESDFTSSFFQDNPLDVYPISWYFLMQMLIRQCKHIYKTQELVGLLQYKGQIDLVVFDALLQDCFLPIIHSLNAPIVLYHGNIIDPVLAYKLQIPKPYSYVTSFSLRNKAVLDFKDRILNTVTLQVVHFIHEWILYPAVNAIAQQVVPDSPKVQNIIKNASLYMGVSDSMWAAPQPTNPITINIGCSHCRPPKQLPQEFQQVVDESGENGFIVFAMGTFFDPKYFPAASMEAFLTVFSRLKQTVIWKQNSVDNLPSNVKTFPWIPQQDLLGNHKARLCITHGGMYSLYESMYHGVPILGMAIFGDQRDNLQVASQMGSVLAMDKLNITVNLLYETITTLLNNPRYKEKAKEISDRIHDQPETPLHRTIYWLEHVMKYKDVSYLKGMNKDIGLHQYFGLDVILLLATIIALPITLTGFCIKKICGLHRCGNNHKCRSKK